MATAKMINAVADFVFDCVEEKIFSHAVVTTNNGNAYILDDYDFDCLEEENGYITAYKDKVVFIPFDSIEAIEVHTK